jgi:uncharacterized membrane protein
MTHLLYSYIGIGALFVVLAVPLMRRLVSPNYWYGFRVPQTLNDRDVWYEANGYAGRGLLWLGVVLMTAAVVLYCVPGVGAREHRAMCMGILMVGIIVNLIQSFRFLGTLKK